MARGVAAHTGHYGLALAEASSLPEEVVRKARALSREIAKAKKVRAYSMWMRVPSSV
jgi:DNA mismatch repair ATPase MutS